MSLRSFASFLILRSDLGIRDDQSATILFSYSTPQDWMQADPHMEGFLALVYSARGSEHQLHIVDKDSFFTTWDYTVRGDILLHEDEKNGLPFYWWTSPSVRIFEHSPRPVHN